jgi:hypothetical protein
MGKIVLQTSDSLIRLLPALLLGTIVKAIGNYEVINELSWFSKDADILDLILETTYILSSAFKSDLKDYSLKLFSIAQGLVTLYSDTIIQKNGELESLLKQTKSEKSAKGKVVAKDGVTYKDASAIRSAIDNNNDRVLYVQNMLYSSLLSIPLDKRPGVAIPFIAFSTLKEDIDLLEKGILEVYTTLELAKTYEKRYTSALIYIKARKDSLQPSAKLTPATQNELDAIERLVDLQNFVWDGSLPKIKITSMDYFLNKYKSLINRKNALKKLYIIRTYQSFGILKE